jgi:hypothetical protein
MNAFEFCYLRYKIFIGFFIEKKSNLNRSILILTLKNIGVAKKLRLIVVVLNTWFQR